MEIASLFNGVNKLVITFENEKRESLIKEVDFNILYEGMNEEGEFYYIHYLETEGVKK